MKKRRKACRSSNNNPLRSISDRRGVCHEKRRYVDDHPGRVLNRLDGCLWMGRLRINPWRTPLRVWQPGALCAEGMHRCPRIPGGMPAGTACDPVLCSCPAVEAAGRQSTGIVNRVRSKQLGRAASLFSALSYASDCGQLSLAWGGGYPSSGSISSKWGISPHHSPKFLHYG